MENSEKKTAEIEILSEKEKNRLLVVFNDTHVDYPKDKTISQFFEEQMEKSPDHIAIGEAGDRFFLSFREFNKKTNQLARLLKEKGVKAGVRVGIMMERSIETVMGILGIIKAGGIYLPIDPLYPENRIFAMLDSTDVSLLLTDTSVLEGRSFSIVDRLGCLVLRLDEFTEKLHKQSGENINLVIAQEDLIYIIFTSGSTGTPKGAGVYHHGFMNLMYWFIAEFGFTAEDSNLLITSLSFDLTQKNLYASLITGGTLYVPVFNYFDPERILQKIRDHHISWINCTPSMFYKLVEYEEIGAENNMESLRYVFLGGEPISITALIYWLESEGSTAEIVNTYGPTECTDICTAYRIKQPRKFIGRSVPLGGPIYNVQLFIVDKNLQVVPVGEPGELLIGGEGVGIGYVNDKQLTTKKFLLTKFGGGESEQLLYRTGDMVKQLADGNFEFLGRFDHQVKVRGIRLELEEIESRLLKHEKVKEVVVLARDDRYGDKYLCAYVVFVKKHGQKSPPIDCPREQEKEQVKQQARIDVDGLISQLRRYLSQHFPDYMIPSYFIPLNKMPLTPNGKINRKALPVPAIAVGEEITLPVTETEKKLAEIWSEVLNIDKNTIGTNTSFFQMGGHSLIAIQIISRIRKELNIEISMMDFFHDPTIAELAKAKAAQEGKIVIEQKIIPRPEQEYYELSYEQRSIWLHSLMEEEGILYNNSLAYTVEGNLNKKAFERAFQTVISRHEILRTCFIMVEGQPKQKVNREFVEDIVYLDFRDKKDRDREKLVKEKVIDELKVSFDLREGLLLKAVLMHLEERKYVFLVTIHHLIFDGWSKAVFMSELLDIYTAICKGKENMLKKLNIQYRDYSIWQNNWLNGEHVTRYKKYWLQQLKGNIPVLDLLIDTPRPTVRNFEGESLEFEIGREILEKLYELSRKTNITLFTTLITALFVLLYKYSGQVDIIIGVDVAGRTQKELEGLIGHFVNMLPIRITADENETFLELLKRVKNVVLGAYDHQEYLFNLMVSDLGIERIANRSPLFDVNISWEIEDYSKLENDFLTVKPCPPITIKTHFDLCFNFHEIKNKEKNESKILTLLSYAADLFEKEYIELMRLRFLVLLESISQNPGSKIVDLDFKIEVEKEDQDSIEVGFVF